MSTSGHWKEESTAVLPSSVSATRWYSSKTGLRVVHVDVVGPVVEGYFTLATESHDDMGLPHILEHGVFLGSDTEAYSYKGVLDQLADLCLARGTNAWTATDHTAYTVTTAGSDGFLTLMPIFVDHILFPTLTDAGVLTEVHHINGEGEDAGVVYCEMQAREHTSSEKAYFALLHGLFPGSGYEANTGGALSELRKVTPTDIRNYHSENYVAENLCLIVAGSIDVADVFAALADVEDKIVARRPDGYVPRPRPWATPAPPISASVSTTVFFPDADETVGEVVVGFRGPGYTELDERTALAVALDYLVETPIAPLQVAFVEREDPLAGSISHWSESFDVEGCVIHFESVPKAKLPLIEDAFAAALTAALAEPWDAERLAILVERRRLKCIEALESRPHATVAHSAIADFVWGPLDGSLFAPALDAAARFAALASREPAYFIELLRKYLADAHRVTVVAEPSAEYGAKLRADEAARLEAQKEALGADGLAAKAAALAEAKAINEIPVPEEVLNSIPRPRIESVSLIPVDTCLYDPFAAPGAPFAALRGLDSELTNYARLSAMSLELAQARIQFDDIPSAFIGVAAYIDTSHLPPQLRQYLPLLVELFFEAPTTTAAGDAKLSHEEMVAFVAANTVKASTSLGTGGSSFGPGAYANYLVVSLEAAADKYATVVELLRDLLFYPADTAQRLRVAAMRLAAEASDTRRDGMTMARSGAAWLSFDHLHHNANAANLVRQDSFLRELADALADETSSAAAGHLAAFASLRAALTRATDITLHVRGALHDLPLLQPFAASVWTGADASPSPAAAPPARITLPEAGAGGPSPATVVLPLASCESTFLVRTCRGVASESDPQLPALLVALQYLTRMEGDFWRELRGLGLSYSYAIRPDVASGLLAFVLYRAAQPEEAYRVAAKIVAEYADGSRTIEPVGRDAAVSATLFTIVDREPTITAAADQSFVNLQLRSVAHDHTAALLKAVSAVTLEDMRAALNTFVLPLFDEDFAHLAVTTNTAAADAMAQFFTDHLGRDAVKVVAQAELDEYFAADEANEVTVGNLIDL
ncbi:uncharacterized protein AMSG_08922 [Thecamonas trahens ATCC 50062]|uniref:Peptidase M16C associated domain-containing protein n=1 Tax=Thecamonas trahens ATCC 50062 TaxID=461836 RepID=A0A0L0DN12_THETB|nr:hypothetical protein AMSG_08922 [Thecamonas trahens ATCC 50062]KNC53416.1 hypothetical protein AMSG_08922 [Thecamonas trahens ATCC 50062]|eukprot:XP_013754455.1 hypothetical protein AMSG_08922 [Thecamonas trahens ATCC 50062]